MKRILAREEYSKSQDTYKSISIFFQDIGDEILKYFGQLTQDEIDTFDLKKSHLVASKIDKTFRIRESEEGVRILKEIISNEVELLSRIQTLITTLSNPIEYDKKAGVDFLTRKNIRKLKQVLSSHQDNSEDNVYSREELRFIYTAINNYQTAAHQLNDYLTYLNRKEAQLAAPEGGELLLIYGKDGKITKLPELREGESMSESQTLLRESESIEKAFEAGETKQIEINDPSKLDPDSDKAYFEKDNTGPEENDIIVGKFIWHRGKSNQTIRDTGTGKQGFSFYRARYVFSDAFLIEDEVLAASDDLTGVIGRAHKEDRELIVINAVKEAENRIRIVSACYADGPKYELFVQKYRESVERGKPYRPDKSGKTGIERVYGILKGSMTESLSLDIERYLRKRSQII